MHVSLQTPGRAPTRPCTAFPALSVPTGRHICNSLRAPSNTSSPARAHSLRRGHGGAGHSAGLDRRGRGFCVIQRLSGIRMSSVLPVCPSLVPLSSSCLRSSAFSFVVSWKFSLERISWTSSWQPCIARREEREAGVKRLAGEHRAKPGGGTAWGFCSGLSGEDSSVPGGFLPNAWTLRQSSCAPTPSTGAHFHRVPLIIIAIIFSSVRLEVAKHALCFCKASLILRK